MTRAHITALNHLALTPRPLQVESERASFLLIPVKQKKMARLYSILIDKIVIGNAQPSRSSNTVGSFTLCVDATDIALALPGDFPQAPQVLQRSLIADAVA